MAREITASLEEMENTISSMNSFKGELESSTNDFSSLVKSLNGRDWNEETGANINSNLEEATNNIRKLIEQLSNFQDALAKIKGSYEDELSSYKKM